MVSLSEEAADYFQKKRCAVDLHPTPQAIQGLGTRPKARSWACSMSRVDADCADGRRFEFTRCVILNLSDSAGSAALGYFSAAIDRLSVGCYRLGLN